MLNKYPLWKYLLIVAVITLAFIYAMPNIYPPDPAIQISGTSSALAIEQKTLDKVVEALNEAGIVHFGEEFTVKNALIRLKDPELQLKAKSVIKRKLGDDFIVALNLAPTTPQWLLSLGATPMKLGLDLSGGVHFLLEVDIDTALEKRLEIIANDIKKSLKDEKIHWKNIKTLSGGRLEASFADAERRDKALDVIRRELPQFQRSPREADSLYHIDLVMSEAAVKEIEDYAVNQNMTTLRNRVNELGVSEPLVQKQGRNRVVVELPGVQDTAEAKRIISKIANLEFRLEAAADSSAVSKERFEFRDPNARPSHAYLEKRIVITGDRVSSASAGYDENGMPQVNISLDGEGGTLMHRTTRNNIKRRLGVLFIEQKTKTHYTQNEAGEEIAKSQKYTEKKIISLATIQSALGTQFRITGLDNPAEASELALLLRAGALAAPMDFVEERTVGPSLGAENIALGLRSVQIGFALVLIFMLVYYKLFGIAANIALALNLVLLAACMSLLSATLTLPGIAGIVLTIGMAVDANVLINARIREELKNGMSPQAAINAGYDRAFVTILDSNLTTLIVAVILLSIGTGPVQGFAVTLSLGILTSMFTAIMVTRAMVNLVYGGRNIQKLSI